MYEKIRLLCKEHGITIAELERRINISNGTIQKWKVSVPTVDRLKKVADYFEVTVDYLVA